MTKQFAQLRNDITTVAVADDDGQPEEEEEHRVHEAEANAQALEQTEHSLHIEHESLKRKLKAMSVGANGADPQVLLRQYREI